MRILVVDDDSFSGEMTSAILEDAGHETVLIESGVEAVDLLASDQGFAVVISDMNMPFVSGLELFEILREEGCHLPFILLSGENPAPCGDASRASRLAWPRIAIWRTPCYKRWTAFWRREFCESNDGK